MSLTDALIELSAAYPVRFERTRDGALELESVVAERETFLAKRRLTYSCRLRMDEAARAVRFFEILTEKGSGLPSGDLDVAPGFGFKKESCKVGGKEREGTIKEQSRLFGADCRYRFDFAAVRSDVERTAADHGYRLDVVPRRRSV